MQDAKNDPRYASAIFFEKQANSSKINLTRAIAKGANKNEIEAIRKKIYHYELAAKYIRASIDAALCAYTKEELTLDVLEDDLK